MRMEMDISPSPSGSETTMYASSPVLSPLMSPPAPPGSGCPRPRGSHKKGRPPPLNLHPQYESCTDIMARARFSSGGSCGDASNSSTSSGSDSDYCSAAQLQAQRAATIASTEPALSAALTASLGSPLSERLNSLPVSEAERHQVDSFFRSLKTQVFVCGSLTNLYFGSSSTAHDGASPSPSAWELRYTGIPVVLLDSGEARARSKRRIQILLAERGSCFTLWQDTIDNLSSYRVAGPAFHTMCLSSDHTTLVGLSFDCPQAAQDLWVHVERLTSCPENISLSGPGARGGRGRVKPKPKPMPLPSKAHISQPCCFQHVTNVDRKDRDRYFSLQTMVPALAEIEKTVPNVS